MPDTAVLDVDGTLVDTNYHHAIAWYRAFRRFDVTLPVWRLHRAIGMGGDQLVPAVAGDGFEAAHGDAVRDAWVEEFDPLLPEVRPFEGARDLLTALGRRGWTVVLASSGKEQHVETYLDLLQARDLVAGWTTSDDADATKPAPDLLQSALEQVGGRAGILLGDSVWDCEAAGNAGMRSLAVRTGGFSDAELTDAGASAVFDSLPVLVGALDETEFARPA